jgi:hypothetical protein
VHERRSDETTVRAVPALVVAIAALIVGLGGVATAGPGRTSEGTTPAQVRKIAKGVADAEIARLARGLSVKSALTANSPALYAQVTAAGIVAANSRGIVQANVSHPEKGSTASMASFERRRAAWRSSTRTCQVAEAGQISFRWEQVESGAVPLERRRTS